MADDEKEADLYDQDTLDQMEEEDDASAEDIEFMRGYDQDESEEEESDDEEGEESSDDGVEKAALDGGDDY